MNEIIVHIRHRRFPLQRSLPIRLYYSTDPDKAMKLIHIKRTLPKLKAIRRSYMYDLEHTNNPAELIQGFKEVVRSIEERYVDVALPRQIVLILNRKRRRYNPNPVEQRLSIATPAEQ